MPRQVLPLAVATFALGCGGNNPPQPPTPQPGVPVVPGTPAPPADGESDTVRKYKQRVKELGEAAESGRVSLIQELLKAGADVNDKDDAGRTALHKAAAKGHQGACVTLLAYGGDPGEGDTEGVTPLMLAADAGHERAVELMQSPLLIEQAVGEVLKESAKQMIGDPKQFLNRLSVLSDGANGKTDKLGQTAVHKAAANGYAKIVYMLMSTYRGRDFNLLGQLDKAGRTPLMLAAANGHADVFAEYKGYQQLAVPLAVKSPDGKTAFDLARENNRTAVLTALEPFQVLVDAAAGDTTAVEKAYKADPAKFPASEVIRVAARNKKLPVLKLVLGWYADKPAAEKASLLGYTNSWDAYTALYKAALADDWAEGVWEMVNPKWWNDGPALKAFISRDVTGVNILDSYYQKASPGSVAAVRKALAEAEKK